MKSMLSLLTLFLIPLIVDARGHRAWSYPQLRDEADTIVIATPTTVEETTERTPLPNITLVSQDGNKSDVIGAGIETTFEVLAVLKGDATPKSLVLHHYRQAEPERPSINGPGLVAFHPKERRRFLMFLKREADGRYCAVSGQTDPYIAIHEIGVYP
ncbi:MAG: hypothetical protein ACHQWV_02370 [Nitrospirales bacterium]